MLIEYWLHCDVPKNSSIFDLNDNSFFKYRFYPINDIILQYFKLNVNNMADYNVIYGFYINVICGNILEIIDRMFYFCFS